MADVTRIKVFAALRDDTHQGWAWLQNASLPPRSVVKITNTSNGKSVYCEALQIDPNFLTQYNQSPRFAIKDPSNSLVLSAWYRAALGGVQGQADVALSIKPANSWCGQFMACIHHPQVVVRLAAWLGGIGLVLGIIGLLLGVASLRPWA